MATSTIYAGKSDKEVEEILDRMLTRLALCDEPKLENLLNKLLPITISSLSCQSSPVVTKIVEYASTPTPPLPPPSLLTPLSSPLLLIPSPPLPLPSPDRRGTIPEADMPHWKRICFIAPSYRFEIGESSAAARQTGHALARGVDYGFIDTLDATIRATDERVMTTLKEVNERMTDLATTHRHDSDGKGNGGDGINRSGDDSGVSGDGGGSGGVVCGDLCGGGVAADSSVSKGSASSAEGTKSCTDSAESAGARCC
nr:proteasome-associated protein ECM29 homolog [Tanacetum cinerariifolium]